MKNQYLVTSSGTKDGNPYSSLARMVQGTKRNGDRYAFADTKGNTISEPEEIPVGTILTYETSRASTSGK